MKAILQRVTDAKVEVDSKTVGEIGTGFLILLGVENGDTEKEADALAAKIAGLRIFRSRIRRSSMEPRSSSGPTTA